MDSKTEWGCKKVLEFSLREKEQNEKEKTANASVGVCVDSFLIKDMSSSAIKKGGSFTTYGSMEKSLEDLQRFFITIC
jgi:hypothetical protein